MRLKKFSPGAFLLPALVIICSLSVFVATPLSAQKKDSNPVPADLNSIQHFVFIVKENRSFDQYFGTYPGVSGATSGMISTGQVIPLSHGPDGYPRNPGYGWPMVTLAIDNGRMDKFDLEEGGNIDGDYLAYSQLYQSDLVNYWNYAQHFVLNDNGYASVHGPSFPNHLYTIGAQSGGAIGHLLNASHWGCDSTAGATTDVINSQGVVTSQFPCFDFPIITDFLDKNQISWLYYTTLTSDWNAMDVINHVRNTELYQEHVPDPSQFVTDAKNGNLPAVSWVIPQSPFSEHPGNSSCEGENWTVQQINAVMQGSDWPNTIIVLAWDDNGGFYDHFPPPQPDAFGLSPRVPWMIISPYSKSGYISHVQYEFSSFLKLVEERFNLPALTQRDAVANDLLDGIDFTQTPLPPFILPTRNCSPVSNSNSGVAFPPQQVGQGSSVKTSTIENYSETSNLTINSISLPPGDFSQTNNCVGQTLGAYKSCTINIVFNPTTTGTRTATMTVKDSDPTSPQTVQLTGVGTNLSLSPPLLSFGTKALHGHTQGQNSTLTNNGSSGVTITGVVTTGDYSQTNTCGGSLAAGASCTISVAFSPTDAGIRYGNVTITDTDGGGPHVLNLTGVGTVISTSKNKLPFTSQALGTTSAPQTFTLTNQGTSALGISRVAIVGSSLGQTITDYAQTNTCGTSVPPRSSCTFSVTFSPVEVGLRAGSVLIYNSEAGTSPQTVSLLGNGVANPVPFVNLPLIPASTAPGGSGFTLTVNGIGFLSSSVVNWNGAPLSTTFVSGTQLTAGVPAGKINVRGTAAVTVSTPGPGGGVSNIAYFQITSALSSVSLSGTTINGGASPVAVATGDFDGTHRQDLAVANQANNTLSILLGRGDGTFISGSTPSTGQGPVAVVTGDFNGDGKVDLVVANNTDNTVSTLLGNGDGTFTPAAATTPTGMGPVSIAVSDVDKDGRLDLAVVNGIDNTVSVLLGKGDGTFYEVSTPIVGKGASSVVAGDFTGDGRMDLAVANRTDNTLSLLKGRGDGTFVLIGSAPVGNGPSAVAAGDFDGDGIVDLVSANQADGSVSILKGNGDGSFGNHVDYPVGTSPSSISLADFNGDSKMDVVVTNAGANTASILLGNGDDTFQTKTDYSTGSNPLGLAVGDYNVDGKPDLVVVNQGSSNLSVLLATRPAH